jgi:hypothetical protein
MVIRCLQVSVSMSEPLLAVRRQLAMLLGDVDGACNAWLQQAKLCRKNGGWTPYNLRINAEDGAPVMLQCLRPPCLGNSSCSPCWLCRCVLLLMVPYYSCHCLALAHGMHTGFFEAARSAVLEAMAMAGQADEAAPVAAAPRQQGPSISVGWRELAPRLEHARLLRAADKQHRAITELQAAVLR